MKAQINELCVEDVPALHALGDKPEAAARAYKPEGFELAGDLACNGARDIGTGLDVLQRAGGALFPYSINDLDAEFSRYPVMEQLTCVFAHCPALSV